MAERFIPIGAHTSDDDIATAATLTAPADATKLMLQCAGADCRYTLDGVAPTAATGFTLKADEAPVIIPVNGGAVVKVIEEGTSSVLEYQFGK